MYNIVCIELLHFLVNIFLMMQTQSGKIMVLGSNMSLTLHWDTTYLFCLWTKTCHNFRYYHVLWWKDLYLCRRWRMKFIQLQITSRKIEITDSGYQREPDKYLLWMSDMMMNSKCLTLGQVTDKSLYMIVYVDVMFWSTALDMVKVVLKWNINKRMFMTCSVCKL